MPLGDPTLDRIRRLRLPDPGIVFHGGLADQKQPEKNSQPQPEPRLPVHVSTLHQPLLIIATEF